MISFAGELLSHAEGLLRDGLHTSEVADGYVQASAKVRPSIASRRIEHSAKGNIIANRGLQTRIRL